MDRETLGKILGWVIITVTAWFAALAVMGYWLADILPWQWTPEERIIHLCLQTVFIVGYALTTVPWRAQK